MKFPGKNPAFPLHLFVLSLFDILVAHGVERLQHSYRLCKGIYSNWCMLHIQQRAQSKLATEPGSNMGLSLVLQCEQYEYMRGPQSDAGIKVSGYNLHLS